MMSPFDTIVHAAKHHTHAANEAPDVALNHVVHHGVASAAPPHTEIGN